MLHPTLHIFQLCRWTLDWFLHLPCFFSFPSCRCDKTPSKRNIRQYRGSWESPVQAYAWRLQRGAPGPLQSGSRKKWMQGPAHVLLFILSRTPAHLGWFFSPQLNPIKKLPPRAWMFASKMILGPCSAGVRGRGRLWSAVWALPLLSTLNLYSGCLSPSRL